MKRLTRFFVVTALSVFVIAGISSCTEESFEPKKTEESSGRGKTGGVPDDGI